MNQKRIPLEGQPREFQALIDGKPHFQRHHTAEAVMNELSEWEWKMVTVLKLVYSAGSWHHEGIVARYFKDRNGNIHQMGKGVFTHTQGRDR